MFYGRKQIPAHYIDGEIELQSISVMDIPLERRGEAWLGIRPHLLTASPGPMLPDHVCYSFEQQQGFLFLPDLW